VGYARYISTIKLVNLLALSSEENGMAESEDTWPQPHYNPGRPKHLHALGVIAIQYASLERSVDILYLSKALRQTLPQDLVELYYYSLNEEKRIEAVRLIFKAYEEDLKVIAAIENLLEYFQWCRNCRNQILHAEQYPAAFGGDKNTLYLTKRVGKQSPKSGYLKFELQTLRSIADQIRAGVAQAAELHLYLRFRGQSPSEIPRFYREFPASLPEKLSVPKNLTLSSTP
jgi:hypothetical protein